MQKNRVYGLILSAGLSGRMVKFKPLLEYNGKSFVLNITEKLCKVCNKVVIVTGYNSELIQNHIKENLSPDKLERLRFVFNEDYNGGMFSSLKKGIEYCNNADWVFYHFVDQPALPNLFYAEFVNEIDYNFNWIQPVKDKRKGHPVLLGKKMIEKIIEASDNSNLRLISNTQINKKFWQCNYKEIFDDIDNIDDYNNLIKVN